MSLRYDEATSVPGAPLVFTFHGIGGACEQYHGFSGLIWPGAAIVSPQCEMSEMDAARFYARTPEGAYSLDELAERAAKMAVFVAEHKARLSPSRVIGLGYSNGANILAATLFAQPDLFDDVVLMHPRVSWPTNLGRSLQGKRALITGGRADQICPLPLVETLADTMTQAGANVQTHLHEDGYEVARSEIDAITSFAQRAGTSSQRVA